MARLPTEAELLHDRLEYEENLRLLESIEPAWYRSPLAEPVQQEHTREATFTIETYFEPKQAIDAPER